MLFAPATSAMTDFEETRGQPEMTRPKMDWPATAAERQLGVVPTAQLYAELRRRGKPVTPEETVAHIDRIEACCAELKEQHDAAVHALSAMSAARDLAAAERDEARATATHERMLREMAETRAGEMEARNMGLCQHVQESEEQHLAQVGELNARVAELEADNAALRADGVIPTASLSPDIDVVVASIAARHSPKATAALAYSPVSRGSETPAAVCGPLSASTALFRAMAAPALTSPTAWMEDADA